MGAGFVRPLSIVGEGSPLPKIQSVTSGRRNASPTNLRATKPNLIPRRLARGAAREATVPQPKRKRTPFGVLCVCIKATKKIFYRNLIRFRTHTGFVLHHFHFPLDSRRSCYFLSFSCCSYFCLSAFTFFKSSLIPIPINVNWGINIKSNNHKECAFFEENAAKGR